VQLRLSQRRVERAQRHAVVKLGRRFAWTQALDIQLHDADRNGTTSTTSTTTHACGRSFLFFSFFRVAVLSPARACIPLCVNAFKLDRAVQRYTGRASRVNKQERHKAEFPPQPVQYSAWSGWRLAHIVGATNEPKRPEQQQHERKKKKMKKKMRHGSRCLIHDRQRTGLMVVGACGRTDNSQDARRDDGGLTHRHGVGALHKTAPQ
jgi:hypothetical protein